jgi:hypothetical protein
MPSDGNLQGQGNKSQAKTLQKKIQRMRALGTWNDLIQLEDGTLHG